VARPWTGGSSFRRLISTPTPGLHTVTCVPVLRRTQALLLSLCLVPAVPPPQVAAWDHPGYDAEDSFYNPTESTINATTVAHLTRRWSVPLRQRDGACTGPSAPLVAAGRVFTTDRLGISAYQATDGRLLWRFSWPDPDDATTPTMAVSGAVLIAANSDCQSQSDPDGTVIALDVATGRTRWQAEVEAPVDSFVLDKGIAVVSGESPSDHQATLAYRATDGHLMWSKTGYAAASLSAAGRVLLTAGTTTTAVTITTGKTLWTKPNRWYAESASPLGDRFYVTDGTFLTSVNTATGAVAWTVPGKARPLLATDGRRIYRAAGNAIEALNATTGRRQWAHQLTRPVGQPLRAGGLLYTGGPVFVAATGTLATTGPAYAGNQVITGGRLYTVTDQTLSSFAP
jgi:outer membrane protein assembly factor BamB